VQHGSTGAVVSPLDDPGVLEPAPGASTGLDFCGSDLRFGVLVVQMIGLCLVLVVGGLVGAMAAAGLLVSWVSP